MFNGICNTLNPLGRKVLIFNIKCKIFIACRCVKNDESVKNSDKIVIIECEKLNIVD